MSRRRVAAGLIVVAGAVGAACGGDPVGSVDAPVGEVDAPPVEVDAPGPVSRLRATYQQTVMNPDGSEAQLAYPPLPAGTTVVIAGAGGARVMAVDEGAGVYAFPQVAVGTPVRALITAPGLVPLEVAWTQGATDAHVVVPLIGRQGATDEVPAGSGWSVTFAGGPVAFPRTLGLSTGAWTEGRKGASGPAPFTYELADLGAPLGGVRAAPDATRGDRGMLLAMPLLPPAGSAACMRSTTGSVTFEPPVLAAGTLSAVPGPAPVWDADTAVLAVTWPRDATRGRFLTELGLLAGTESGRLAFGYMPSHAIPAFTRAGGTNDRGQARPLPVPAMLTVLECPFDRDTTDPFAPVDLLEATARATAHVQITSTRSFTSLSGQALTLVSGLDIATATTGTGPATHAASFALTAPLPRNIRLTQGVTSADLMSDVDGGMFAGSEPTLELTFGAHDEDGEHSDYWSVTLVQVTGAMHQAVRTVLTTETATGVAVSIPASELVAGQEYTFEIRAYTGYPGAATGDYTLVTFPQSMTTVATRTFRRG